MAVAYPFVSVELDLTGLAVAAQRSPGVIAIVGVNPVGEDGGSAELNKPHRIDELSQAASLFSKVSDTGVPSDTPLYKSLEIALKQNPKPSKVYGVRAADGKYADALASLEAADDVTFVCLANEVAVGAATGGGTKLTALKKHCENMSAAGLKRIGFAMVNPAKAKTADYATKTLDEVKNLKSISGRMVIIASRGTNVDVAAAAMAATAGRAPHISTVLKPLNGVSIPLENQYGPSEITTLSEGGLIPLIDPALIPGTVVHMAEAKTFGANSALGYIDIVRVLDDIEFRLKAGLIGLVGDARITRFGLTRVKTQIHGILEPLQRRAIIDGFSVQIPVLDFLNIPAPARTAGQAAEIVTAKGNRAVDVLISVTYGPAVHTLKVTLAPKF